MMQPNEDFAWDDRQDQPAIISDSKLKRQLRQGSWRYHAVAAASIGLKLPSVGWHYLRRRALGASRNHIREMVGVSIDPFKYSLTQQLELIEQLSVEHIQFRLFPNREQDFDQAFAAAQQCLDRGLSVHLVLPQQRSLVTQPALWRERCQSIHQGLPESSRLSLQLGCAINRLKWGCVHPGEYLQLVDASYDCFPGRQVLGSSVIDFEPLLTAETLFHRRPWQFAGNAALLYVDRRGAPENKQYGYFDTRRKIQLLAAMTRASSRCTNELWLTEVNWPLRGHEGYAPAGDEVCVDEASAADYLASYLRIAWQSQQVQRVYVWQLLAQGYGLVDPRDGRLRPAFRRIQEMLVGSERLTEQ